MTLPDYFVTALGRTLAHEGVYSKDPVDRGGETFRGISRRYWPSWEGWRRVDELKGGPNFLERAASDVDLQAAVSRFYRTQFWDPLRCGEVPSERVACELLDTAVNMGIQTAVLFLQRALNLLNRCGAIYPDLVEDGVMGVKTLGAVKLLLSRDKPEMLALWMNVFQGARYAELMRKSPLQEKYARGWAARVSLTKF